MATETSCPNGHRLQVLPEQVGGKVRCPTCQTVFVAVARPAGPPSGEPVRAAADAREEPLAAAKPGGGSAARMAGEAWRNTLSQRGPLLVGSQIVLGLGLLLVLSSRGCESLAARNVAALQAQIKLSQSHFDDTWEAKRQTLEDQIQTYMAKETLSAADRDELTRLRDQQKKSVEDAAKQRKDLERGEWHELGIAARDADAEALTSAYWHQFWFTVGTILLAFGLLAVGFNGQGAERWICLAMLVILMYSVYVAVHV